MKIIRIYTAILFLSILSCLNCIAQTNDFSFFIKKIIIDYPGFKDKTNKADFIKFSKKVLRENAVDTFKAMSIIANSFGDRHLVIYQTKESIKFDYNNCKNDLQSTTIYLGGNSKKKKYEGYWLNDYNDCVIGIRQISQSPVVYKAYIIESLDSVLPPGRVQATFEYINNNTYLTDEIGIYSKARSFLHTVFRNDSVFTSGAVGKWKKLQSYSHPILKRLPQFSYYTTARSINDSTYLIKIPGGTERDGEIIDSIIAADKKIISKAKTLIIDLTNNPGGKSGVYIPILQFLYTNKIYKHQTKTYCTKDNIDELYESVKDYINHPAADTTIVKYWKERLKLMAENIGEFILNKADTIQYDSVYKRPKHVGIIINYACQSATELMILMSKQSSKVKLFGEHTIGAADYLDFGPKYLPSKRYKIYIATSKRIITSDGPKIDEIGIYPDISISDTVIDWQKFVVEYYERK